MRARAHTHPAYPYPLQNPTGGGGEEEGPRDTADSTLEMDDLARDVAIIATCMRSTLVHARTH